MAKLRILSQTMGHEMTDCLMPAYRLRNTFVATVGWKHKNRVPPQFGPGTRLQAREERKCQMSHAYMARAPNPQHQFRKRETKVVKRPVTSRTATNAPNAIWAERRVAAL